MMFSTPTMALATASLVCGTALRAQEGDPLPVPARVRVVAPPLVTVPMIAVLTARTADSLLLTIPIHGRLLVSLASVHAIEISRGAKGKAATGALVGLVVGSAFAAAFLAGFCGGDTLCEVDEVVRAFVIIGTPPTVVGALIGSAARTEAWERVSPNRFPLSSVDRPQLRFGARVPLAPAGPR